MSVDILRVVMGGTVDRPTRKEVGSTDEPSPRFMRLL